MTTNTTRRRHAPSSGFTLIEVLLAVAVTAMAMVAVSGAFLGTLRARSEIESLSESTIDGERILTLLERDLEGLWHHNIARNRVFVGRNMDIAGYDADRLDFYTTSDAISGVPDTTDQIAHPSICEVGYWLRENPRVPGMLELWRREDPMIDGDILAQDSSAFQLVCDRLKDFNITYYETLGARAEEIYEWDSSREQSLPRRMKIEFTVHRRVANRNAVSGNEVADFEKILKKYERHFVFDPRMTDILAAGVALVPVLPPRPEIAMEGGGGGGAGGPGDGMSNSSAAVTPLGGEADGGPGGNRGPGASSEIGFGQRGNGSGDAGGRGRGPGGRGPGGRGGGPPPGIPQGNRPQNLPVDLGELLRNGGLGGGGGGAGGLFGGLGGR